MLPLAKATADKAGARAFTGGATPGAAGTMIDGVERTGDRRWHDRAMRRVTFIPGFPEADSLDADLCHGL